MRVDIDNARLSFDPSTDSEVRVTLEGRYSNTVPELSVATVGGVTEITGGCDSGFTFFTSCDVEVIVSMPASLPLEVEGTHGAVTVRDSASPQVDAASINGRIEMELDEAPMTVIGHTAAERTVGQHAHGGRGRCLPPSVRIHGSAERPIGLRLLRGCGRLCRSWLSRLSSPTALLPHR